MVEELAPASEEVCNPRPLKEWVAEAHAPDQCPPCILPVGMAWYYEELNEHGQQPIAAELDLLKDTGNVDQVADFMDQVKGRVDPALRTRLLEYDCAMQSFHEGDPDVPE